MVNSRDLDLANILIDPLTRKIVHELKFEMLTTRQLAEKFGLTRMKVGCTLTKLERRGFIGRKRTAEGRLSWLRREAFADVAEFFGDVSEAPQYSPREVRRLRRVRGAYELTGDRNLFDCYRRWKVFRVIVRSPIAPELIHGKLRRQVRKRVISEALSDFASHSLIAEIIRDHPGPDGVYVRTRQVCVTRKGRRLYEYVIQ